MLKRPCHFFNTTGKCRFGKHCKFVHSIDISQPAVNSDNQQDEILNSASAASCGNQEVIQQSSSTNPKNQDEGIKSEKPAPRRVKTSRALCRSYADRRFCRYGNRCRYSHVLPESEEEDSSVNSGNVDSVKDEKQLIKLKDNEVQNQVQDEGVKKSEVKDKVDQKSQQPQKSNVKKVVDGPKNDRLEKKVCRYFKHGFCRLGGRCRFNHPEPLSQTYTPKNSKEQAQAPEPVEGDTPQAETKSEGWKQVVRPPRILNVYQRDDISAEKLKEIRNTEITQLKRRFPPENLKILSETDELASFVFTFMPTDPDWPFDVREFDIQVDIDAEYPVKLFKTCLPLDQDLPATVLRYIEVSLQEWVVKKEEECLKKGIVELLFRPFLRWMDRNMETIVTQGLKQLQRELRAQAAGLVFIPAKELKKETVTDMAEGMNDMSLDSVDMTSEKDNRRPVLYRKGEVTDETYVVPSHDSTDDTESSESSDAEDETETEPNVEGAAKTSGEKVHTRPVIDPDTPRRGTEVSLKNINTWYLTTLLMEKLHLVIQCDRCKNKTDFSTPPNRVNSIACSKCNNNQLVVFRPLLAHSYSSILGYLDLDGCSAFDIIFQDCHMSIGCLKCNRDALLKKFTPGKQTEFRCRGCHTKIGFSIEAVKLSFLTSDGIDSSKFSGSVHTVKVRKNQRVMKDPAISEGNPLPDNGACKHYRKSFRWLRFPCCGKTYPCDVCHDSKEDHEMKYANRMICGYCCKEQPFSVEKPCSGCSSALTKARTSHWEGGRGCRDKITMNRTDDKKYSNINKTISNKAKAAQEKNKGKKNTKLRHI